MYRNTFFIFLLSLCLSACTSETSENQGESPGSEPAPSAPAEIPPMPDDFYVAIREKGGSEPYDNIFYVSPDSVSYERYYFNLRSLDTLSPDRAQVEDLYRRLYEMNLSTVQFQLDSIPRVFERGGDIAEMRMNDEITVRSNADNSTILEASWPNFNQYCNAVREFVLADLDQRIARVDLEIEYKDDFKDIAEVNLTANNFQLIAWNNPYDESPAPSTGYNAVLPGQYHLFGRVRVDREYLSVQDTLHMTGRPRRLKMNVFSKRIEIKKLN